ncbi:hypothetical protein RhiirC2_785958 [Rhizophagus irregularis]|uniref:Uncharacterized protein n=1 Tax=Rhizophagus irregularis TaxID=588596 RepID=A0A2N1MVA2_9GLOM|nr:hypothetical protein RhiirC2_785958 [Rhizophagus irregularis]
MEYSITDYDYLIKELELMMNYDDHAPNSYSNDAGWDNCYQDFNDNNSFFSPVQADSIPSIMPDASFSAFNPNSILSSSRHAFLPNRIDFGIFLNDPSRLCQEISFVSNTHKNLSNQLDFILKKLDFFSFPNPPFPSK